jgi:DNA-binding LytR/AlgR family response regulator
MVSVFDSGRNWFKEEQKKQESGPEITLTAENGKDIFNAPLYDILLIHSSGNYVEIYWLENQKKRKKLFRQTFATVENYLGESSGFKKCHRCWLVNIQRVDRLSGNSRGYFLEIDKLDFKIPVSRNYIPSFREVFS